MSKAVLIFGQATLVLITITSAAPRIEPTCWGPGVWPHPHYCRLFSLCLLDASSAHSMVSGRLFLCPPGMGFSTGRNACVPSRLVANCYHNSKNADSVLEVSSAEHLLPPKNTSQFHCAGHTVPYCDGSDILVVCGPNQGLLGAVNCSTKVAVNFGMGQCDKKSSKCVALNQPAVEGQGLISTSTPYENLKPSSNSVSNGGSKSPHPSQRGSNRQDPAVESSTESLQKTTKHKANNTTTKKEFEFHKDSVLRNVEMNVKNDTEPYDAAVQKSIFDINFPDQVKDKTIISNKYILYFNDSGVDTKSVTKDTEMLVQSNKDISLPYHKEMMATSFTCKHPGKQCTSKNTTLLIDCSDNLQVFQVWECVSFFPQIMYRDNSNLRVFCDPQQDSCAVHAGSTTNASLNEEPYKKVSQHDSNERNKEVNVKEEEITFQDRTEYTCQRSGIQCVQNNDTVIIECTDDMKILHVWDCATLYPSEAFLAKSNAKVRCDPKENSCVMHIGSAVQEPVKKPDMIGNRFQENQGILKEQNNNKFPYTCKHPGMQCTNHNYTILLECSDTLEVLNVWPCVYLFPAEIFQGRDYFNVKCDSLRDSCVVYLEAVAEGHQDKTDMANTFYNDKRIQEKDSQHSQYLCKQPGMQCTSQNTSVLLECSENLKLLHLWDCNSMISPGILNHSHSKVKCDPHHASCILYMENSNHPEETEAKVGGSGNHLVEPEEKVNENGALQDISTDETNKKPRLCTKPGKQCTSTNSSVLLDCSDNLEVLYVWNCVSLFPAETFSGNDDIEVQCNLEEDSCVLFYPDTVTSTTQAPTREQGMTKTNQERIGTTDTNKKIDMQTLITLKNQTEIITQTNASAEIVSTTQENEESYEENGEDGEEEDDGEEASTLSSTTTASHKITSQSSSSKPHVTEHTPSTVRPSISDFNDNSGDNILQACQREGLQCANNGTIMDCPYDLTEPTFMMSCSDMIQISHSDNAFGFCDSAISSCVLKVNQQILNLKLSLFDIGEYTVFPDFVSKCATGGLHCADNMTLVMCSGFADNIDYAITCGSHRMSTDGQIMKAFCDPQIESCVIATHSNDSVASTNEFMTQNGVPNDNSDNSMTTTGKTLDMNVIPGTLMSPLKRTYDQPDSPITQILSSTLNPILTSKSYNSLSNSLQKMYNTKLMGSSSDTVTKLLDKLSIESLKETMICQSAGWHCLNEDTLVLCSQQLSLQGFLPCAEASRGSNSRSFCDSATSKCVIEKESPDSVSLCTKPGLQCLDSKTIGLCSFTLKLEYSLACATIRPDSYCNQDLIACISPSMHVKYTPAQ